MTTYKFFDESTDQSQVKTAVVSKYFYAWAKVIIPSAKKHSGKIAYIDLFAGPGRYKDRTKSTPIKVLETAIGDPDLKEMLVTIFNDKDSKSTQSLEKEIQNLPNLKSLKYPPQISNHEVGDEIVKMFEQMTLVPTLFFVDPWGYKGLSLRLVNSVLKDWGCDCIFFFNYNRINMGLNNDAVKEHIDALFGKERGEQLRKKLEQLNPNDREMTIIEELSNALKDMGGKYVLPFGFVGDKGVRTSHHLIFVSKHVRGYTIMKDIMANESSTVEQGVPSFAYNPADIRQPLLFELSRPLDELSNMLLEKFAGKSMKMIEIFDQHHVGHRFIKKNYKNVLLQLENQGKIKVSKHKKNSFGDNVMVTFPLKGVS